MSFDEIVAQVKEQLGREGRLAYRIIKRRFGLSDDDLEDLKADLIDAKRVAIDEEGKVLVWISGAQETERAAARPDGCADAPPPDAGSSQAHPAERIPLS